MQIYLNGQPVVLATQQTLDAFLTSQNLPALTYAVALNSEHVPRHLYGEHILNSGDRIEIVVPVQGG